MNKILKTFFIIFIFLIFIQNTFSFDYILGVENKNFILNNKSKILDLDVLDNDKNLIKNLKQKNKFLIGYVNAGSIENYRDDYKKFSKDIIGKNYPGWEDERFLYIKNYKKFQKNILNRLDIAKQKGFDAIEFDNIDTFDNFKETGFNISVEDELVYLNFLEKQTHNRGLNIFQKNAPELVKKLVENFDGAIVEGGFYNDIINDFLVYIKSNKPVYNIEYTDNTSEKDFLENICLKSEKLGVISILKNRDLDEFIIKCENNRINKQESIKKKISEKLDKIIGEVNKKYSANKKEVLYENILKKIIKLKQNKKYKNKIVLLEIIEKRFNLELKNINSENNVQKTNNILIKTNFENIILEIKVADLDGVWWQKIGGKNMNLMGYDTQLQLLVDGNKDINKYIKTEIKTTIGKNKKTTKALHLEIIKKEQEDTQLPLITYTDGKEIEELNIKYSLKFPKNLADKLGKDGWAVINEYKTTGDFRLAIYVYADENKKLYWYMHGDNVVNEPKNYKEFWFKQNRQIKVPVGEWFDVDIFWKRGVSDGEVVFKVGNKKVLEYYGKTKINDNINAIMYFTNYASNPIDIWIDNFEVSGKSVKQKLIPKKDKIYFGAFQEFGGGETEVSKQKLENFEELIGKKPSWAYFSQDFAEEGIKFPKKNVEKIIKYGEVPFIRLMPSMVYEKKKKFII